jgi:hypothetical protein
MQVGQHVQVRLVEHREGLLPPSFDALPAVDGTASPYRWVQDDLRRRLRGPAEVDPGNVSPWCSARCAVIVDTLSNGLVDWPSSVARQRMNGDFTGRPTGSPLASQPSNRAGPSASAQARI